MFKRLVVGGLLYLIGEVCWGTSLAEVGKQYGLKYVTHETTIELKNSKHYFSFIAGSKEAILDHTKVFLTYPIKDKKLSSNTLLKRIGRQLQRLVFNQKEYDIDPIDVQKTIFPILFSQKISKNKGKIIVIDPGHGGKAHGAVNRLLNLKEKDLTLQMALKLKQKLKQCGYTVYLTREFDKDISLEERSAFANRVHGSVFISLHYNSATVARASGIESFTYTFAHCPSTDRMHPNISDRYIAPVNHWDCANTWLSYCIQKSLIASLKMNDRGVRHGRMKVLEGLNCPGILIEGGFISNPQEVKKIMSFTYQNTFANAIVNGLKYYFQQQEMVKASYVAAEKSNTQVIPNHLPSYSKIKQRLLEKKTSIKTLK